MLNTIICLASMFAISFAIRETDGPFNIITKIRSFLLHNKYVGVFFYQLLQCYFCIGFYSGGLVYLLHQHFHHLNIYDLLLWMLAGSTISFMGNLLMSKWSDK